MGSESPWEPVLLSGQSQRERLHLAAESEATLNWVDYFGLWNCCAAF